MTYFAYNLKVNHINRIQKDNEMKENQTKCARLQWFYLQNVVTLHPRNDKVSSFNKLYYK